MSMRTKRYDVRFFLGYKRTGIISAERYNESLQIDVCQSVVPHDDDDVNSKAIVKLQTVQLPVSFARLQCNTDLKMPPSNWLTNSANSYGLQQALSHSTGFTR